MAFVSQPAGQWGAPTNPGGAGQRLAGVIYQADDGPRIIQVVSDTGNVSVSANADMTGAIALGYAQLAASRYHVGIVGKNLYYRLTAGAVVSQWTEAVAT